MPKRSLCTCMTTFMNHEASDPICEPLRADLCKYRPEVGKIKFLKNPKKKCVHCPRYSSDENINFSFIG